MILLVGSNKGGSGKTTMACNLAVVLAKRGNEVCLVDADKQGSSANWCNERETLGHNPSITVVQKYDNISKTLLTLAEKFSEVIVDVAGRNSREMITAAAVADVLLCPSQCSQLDLDTLSELQEQVEKVKDINPKLKVYIYQTMASTNPKVMERERADFEAYVREFPEFSPLKSIGRYRKVYRDVFSEGLSILESDNDSAVNEIMELYKEVYLNG
jgi:chromosome partitioning protein